jgi:type IV pilus assembly protein PilE
MNGGRMTVRKSGAGFTLIEVMIVVTIIGILAAVAIPSYSDHIRKSHRADAQAALIALAQNMERRYSETNSYCDSGTDNPATCGDSDTIGDTGSPLYFSSQVPLDGGDAIYNLTIEASHPTDSSYDLSDTSFTIMATRVTGAYMDGDECGDFVYTNSGLKTQVNNTSTDCDWP